MSSPTVSVIIPTYNGAEYLREAVQCILDQTYPHFELIVVNDVSPDHTDEVIEGFKDPRLTYIKHEENLGADLARMTGLHASSGDIIAFLDQDDLFHPERLQAHVSFLEKHPDIGLSYNPRFDIGSVTQKINGLWFPPQTITLADLVLGFPISPSETVLRREWAFVEEIWDQSFVFEGEEIIVNGGEIVFCGRLFLNGCKFGYVEQVLNYRRHQPNRVLSDLSARCRAECRCQEIVLTDSRVPVELMGIRDLAFMNSYLIWAYFAFSQAETDLGTEFVQEAVRLRPTILDGNPCDLVSFFAAQSVFDESHDHEDFLQVFFNNLPQNAKGLRRQEDWAIARGYLLKGIKDVMWYQAEDAGEYFQQAVELNADIDELFLRKLADDLIKYEVAFGIEKTRTIFNSLIPYIEQVGGRAAARQLKSIYAVVHAFQSYHKSDFVQVPRDVLRAVLSEPKHATNRGLWSIFFRSLLQSN